MNKPKKTKVNKPPQPKAKKPPQRKTNKIRATSQPPAVDREFDPSTNCEELHLKYPPENSWRNVSIKDSQEFRSLFLGDWELLGNEDRMNFDSSLFRLRNWESPFDLLQLLWAADKLKVYPPPSVLSILAKAIESYFLTEGKMPLDKCLGLVWKRGKGSSYFTKSKEHTRDTLLCEQMETLRYIWGLTIPEAAHMVASANPGTLEEATIKSRYDKEWKKLRIICHSTAIVHSCCWSRKDKKKFLGTFPVHSLPPHLRTKHPSDNPKEKHN